jgi:hypothetical protein
VPWALSNVFAISVAVVAGEVLSFAGYIFYATGPADMLVAIGKCPANNALAADEEFRLFAMMGFAAGRKVDWLNPEASLGLVIRGGTDTCRNWSARHA